MSSGGSLLSTSLTAGEEANPRIVGGHGVWFRLSDGREVIDASNTAAPLGHCHPEIIEAVRRAADAPVINEGWQWAEREQAAEDLLRIAFAGEDWAARGPLLHQRQRGQRRRARAVPGADRPEGPRDQGARLPRRRRAGQGADGAAAMARRAGRDAGGIGPASAVPPRLATVHELPAPAGARVTGQPDPTAGTDWLPSARAKLARSAAVLLDYSQGGIYHSPDYQDRVAALAAEQGAYWIADETVTGFGRVGGWFQFQHGTSPARSGHDGQVPVRGRRRGRRDRAVPRDARPAQGHELAELLHLPRAPGRDGGDPCPPAGIQPGGPVQACDDLDAVMYDRLAEVAAQHPSVARIDGRGLHWTIELHGPDWRSWRGEEANPLASRVVARALAAGALIATSGEQTSLFLAPPLIVSETELSRIFDALHHGLELADTELAASSA